VPAASLTSTRSAADFPRIDLLPRQSAALRQAANAIVSARAASPFEAAAAQTSHARSWQATGAEHGGQCAHPDCAPGCGALARVDVTE